MSVWGEASEGGWIDDKRKNGHDQVSLRWELSKKVVNRINRGQLLMPKWKYGFCLC